MYQKYNKALTYLQEQKKFIDAQIATPASGYLYSGIRYTGKSVIADYFCARLVSQGDQSIDTALLEPRVNHYKHACSSCT